MKTKIQFVFSVNSAAVLHANGEEGIQSECQKLPTRIIPNTGNFHAVKTSGIFERFCLIFRNICYEEPALFNTLNLAKAFSK